jgi:hypothetical protein
MGDLKVELHLSLQLRELPCALFLLEVQVPQQHLDRGWH